VHYREHVSQRFRAQYAGGAGDIGFDAAPGQVVSDYWLFATINRRDRFFTGGMFYRIKDSGRRGSLLAAKNGIFGLKGNRPAAQIRFVLPLDEQYGIR
jgi:hypothetical protein